MDFRYAANSSVYFTVFICKQFADFAAQRSKHRICLSKIASPYIINVSVWNLFR